MFGYFKIRCRQILKQESGMELVQVAILVAIAIGVGLLFKDKITDFVTDVFKELSGDSFL